MLENRAVAVVLATKWLDSDLRRRKSRRRGIFSSVSCGATRCAGHVGEALGGEPAARGRCSAPTAASRASEVLRAFLRCLQVPQHVYMNPMPGAGQAFGP